MENMHQPDRNIREERVKAMASRISGVTHRLLESVFETLDKAVQSPPPDDHDVLIVVEEQFPTLGIPLPDDGTVLRAISDLLGQPADPELVRKHLEQVWRDDEESQRKAAAVDIPGNIPDTVDGGMATR